MDCDHFFLQQNPDLSDDELELLNERAGVREFDGGYQRDYAEFLSWDDWCDSNGRNE